MAARGLVPARDSAGPVKCNIPFFGVGSFDINDLRAKKLGNGEKPTRAARWRSGRARSGGLAEDRRSEKALMRT
jgi:hypothetical protein